MSKKKRYHITLDNDTLEMIVKYAEKKLGTINISQAIRLIVREYLGDNNERNKK